MSEPAGTSWRLDLPQPHFMGFAPLDVWCRFLFGHRLAIPPRYWPRLFFALLLSLVFTILTLPERLLLALWFWLKPRPVKPLPGPVIILGYYRSGTTLLQYLLDCDPNLYSPHWASAFAPQGFLLSWTLMRWGILPFSPRKRPQDEVSFGPLVPAEDDFALNNWGLASTLPGRLVVPRDHAYYDRFHDLHNLTPPEMSRWRRYQYALVRKLGLLAGRRRVLLKTPAHTARIEALLDLFKDTTGPKFVYISRHPHSVLRSNVSMLQLLPVMYGLQEPLSQQELEDYLLQEYLDTEAAYVRTRGLIPAGSLAEVRLQDLLANPLGELERIYRELNLPLSQEFLDRVVAYMHEGRSYKPNIHSKWTPEQEQRLGPPLELLIKQGRHEEPTIAKVELPPDPLAARRRQRQLLGWLGGLAAMALAFVAWLGLGHLLGTRCDPLVWPAGMAVGYGVLRPMRKGSPLFGLGAALGTLLVFLGIMTMSPNPAGDVPFWQDPWTWRTVLWGALGMATAYRIASQR